MRALVSQYKSLFRIELEKYGFTNHKKTFYRVVNDVIQTLMLKNTRFDCTIEFNILPLSLLIDNLYCEGYSIAMLREQEMRGRSWRYHPSLLYDIGLKEKHRELHFNDGTKEDIVQNMMLIVLERVIPIFERVDNCVSALQECVKFEEAVYGKVIFIPNNSTYFTHLKTENYDEASLYIAALIKGSEMAIAENIADFERHGKFEQRDSYKAKKEQEVEKLKEELHRLLIPDADFFRKLVAENETKSLEYLQSLVRV